MKHERYSPNYFFGNYLEQTKYKEYQNFKLNKWEDIEIIGKKNIVHVLQILQEIIEWLAKNVNDKTSDILNLIANNISHFADSTDTELEKTINMMLNTELLLNELKNKVTWIEDLKYLSIISRDFKEKFKKMEVEEKPTLAIFRQKNYFHPGKPMLVYMPYFQERKKGEPIWSPKKDANVWQIKAINENGELEIEGKKISLNSSAIMEVSEFQFLQQELKKSTNFLIIWVQNGISQNMIEDEELLGAIWKARDLNLNAELHRQAAISQGEMPIT